MFLIIALIVLGLIAGIWLGFCRGLRSGIAAIYVLLLPGLIWSYVVFKLNEINLAERVLYAVVISILVVPIVVFLAFKVGIAIVVLSMILEILAIIVFGAIALFIKQTLTRHKKQP